MNIILIGMSGSGKTTIGEYFKKNYRMDVLDTDMEIKRKIGMEIEDIFKEHGEDYFRNMETHIIKENKDIDNCLIATGGGIILREENRRLLEKLGYRILLSASSETLVRNLKNSKEVRPLLKDAEDLKKDIEKMISERREKYLAAADFIINIDNKSVGDIVNEIVKAINLDR